MATSPSDEFSITPSSAYSNGVARYTTRLPTQLYLAEQVRELDRIAIEEHQVAGIRLMKRAGRAAFGALLDRWPETEQITVFCGAGNNGGDGYIVAALAAQRRIPVTVVHVAAPEKLKGDALRAYEFALREGVLMQPFDEQQPVPASVLVDALLGTGLKGDVRSEYRQAIEKINASGLPVLSVDLPSGLCADTGVELGLAVKAEVTISFIGLKQGLLSGRGPALCGQLLYSDLELAEEITAALPPASHRLDLATLLERLPARDADSHKGHFGHVMVVGGDHGFAGAALMAGEAAARCGSGLTSVVTRAEHLAAIIARCPELMATAVASGQELKPLLQRPSVLVIGPGLGRSPWSEQLLLQAAQSDLPQVLDADALNILAEGKVVESTPRANRVLTPHPGEAARLLGCSVAEVQADRFKAVQTLQRKYGGVVLLKGAGTLIADEQQVYVANVGNPGMASGGMGDVLSGMIGALLAQGLSPLDATCLAVCLHGSAADLAAEESGQRGLLATDLLLYARQLLNSEVAV
ncbi:NAD(P)H-hydrate dehydratase [Pseudomaricurvus alkylphenolicus]|uniref:NAD(P)H-hydrate dehydratase n=1 Tax=Pseudomaricurvus alkylphenolicus TaxID=1306991 RepID=UPI001422A2CC|nr:NAD(P)H-hydrate dehydratase [Pseudomaricurvus alkylphenolicus]NIB39328.1 NAD(P)H-hydrate dehydratase [Pseudomaricurvus alkylphenolicus]